MAQAKPVGPNPSQEEIEEIANLGRDQDQQQQGNDGQQQQTQGQQAQGTQQTGGAQQNPVKDPEDWATGDEPITGPQQSYLSTLAQEAGEDIDVSSMTKAQASEKIEELQAKTGREGGTGTTSVGSAG